MDVECKALRLQKRSILHSAMRSFVIVTAFVALTGNSQNLHFLSRLSVYAQENGQFGNSNQGPGGFGGQGQVNGNQQQPQGGDKGPQENDFNGPQGQQNSMNGQSFGGPPNGNQFGGQPNGQQRLKRQPRDEDQGNQFGQENQPPFGNQQSGSQFGGSQNNGDGNQPNGFGSQQGDSFQKQ
ncbi:hypothetical protein M3Y98_01219700 [Aphelenchoides besseyi]|nr:hypothetical protein M3Y98_01219700 [Aphelenchoides besseyi]KAI6193325.1 hypothetical protein M3Y96_01006100 [Aphelenchoides besseyi]